MAPSLDKALALEQCERDLDSAIERLLNLRLEPAQDSNEGTASSDHGTDQLATPAPAQAAAAAETSLPPLPSAGATTGGTEWVDILVNEMASASSMDDARSRAARVLGAFECYVTSRAAQDKLELEAVVRQNAILKRAVAVQHRRHKQHERKCKELENLVAQYQAQVRSLEVDKYALSMHLRQAQQPGSSLPGRFHPEIF